MSILRPVPLAAKPRVVVVLGMHRSGTSVITKALEILGCNLGSNLMAPGHDNPRGFFEDNDVVELNKKVFEAIGHNWDSLPLMDKTDFDELDLTSLVTRARHLMLVKSSKPPYAFKDPRTTALIHFWEEVLTYWKSSTAAIIVARNPYSIAHSLHKRDKLSQEYAFRLWQDYMSKAVFCKWPALVVDYDNLMDFPAEGLARISGFLRLKDRDEHDVTAFMDFCDKQLRHNKYTSMDGSIPSQRELWDFLTEAAIAPLMPIPQITESA